MKYAIKTIMIHVVSLLALLSIFSVDSHGQDNHVSWREALSQDDDWYSSDEAIRIADNLLLYQNENGGWAKNIDMAKVLSDSEKKKIRDEVASGSSHLNQTTIDNKASHTQMRYLAKVYSKTGTERFKENLLKAINYLLEAQYDNGGWPQFYPIREGYYEHITYNDGAMIGVMNSLKEIASDRDQFSFVDKATIENIEKALEKGLKIILETQIEVEGKLTAWCAQHDRHTLEPAKARAYELPSISGGESVGIIRYLMDIENPSPEVVKAVQSAVAWYEKVKLTQIRKVRVDNPDLPQGYDVVIGFAPEGSEPLWARFYEIGTNYPMFVNRDGEVNYSYSQLDYERKMGYSWMRNYAEKLLNEEYPEWCEKWDI